MAYESIGAELPPLAEIIDDLAAFLMPYAAMARGIKAALYREAARKIRSLKDRERHMI
jgi:hypothetical protein